MEEKIRELLSTIVHPETGKNLVESGFIEHTAAAGGKVTVVPCVARGGFGAAA